MGTPLARIRKIEAPNCQQCTETVQLVEHLYTKYHKWRKKWRKLVKGLETKGITQQPLVERKWLVKLIANKNVVVPLCEFFKTIGVEGREGAGEKKVEWEQISD